MRPIKNKYLFYFLSLTWGLPLTLFGSVTALFLILTGHKPERYGYCRYFTLKGDFGGFEGGIFFVRDSSAGERINAHELGHGIQNCYLGPFEIILVTIPSAIRYWYRRLSVRKNAEKKLKDYDAIWFEAQATRLGNEYIKSAKEK